jgi:hypothetical protein
LKEGFDRLKDHIVSSTKEYILATQDQLINFSQTQLAFLKLHNQLGEKPRLVRKRKFRETAGGLLRVLFLISAAMPSKEIGVIEKKLPAPPWCKNLEELCMELARASYALGENYNNFMETRQLKFQKASKKYLLIMDEITHKINDEILRQVEGA